MIGTHILSKQNFLLAAIWAVILDFSVYNQLLYQFMLAVSDTTDHAEHLVYDTSCQNIRFDSLKFWPHRVPLKMTLWEHKVIK